MLRGIAFIAFCFFMLSAQGQCYFCTEELISCDPTKLLKKLDEEKLLKKLRKTYPSLHKKVVKLIKKGNLEEGLKELQPLLPYANSHLQNNNIVLAQADDKQVLEVVQKLLNHLVIRELPCCLKNESQSHRSCLVKALMKSNKRCWKCKHELSEADLEKLAFLLQSYSCKSLTCKWIADCAALNKRAFEFVLDRAYPILLGGFISIVIVLVLTTTTLVPTSWVPWALMALVLSDLFGICCLCLICSDSFICSGVHCVQCEDPDMLV